MMRRNLLGIIVLLCFASCEKEQDAAPVEKASQWQEDDRFLFDLKVQFNSHADANHLFLMGRQTLSDVELKDSTEEVEHPILLLSYDQNYKMPVSSQLFLTANSQFVRIAPTANPVSDGADLIIRPEELDSTFFDFSFPPFWLGEAMLINTRGECLIPYSYLIDAEQGLYGIKALLVITGTRGEFKDMVDTLKTTSLVVSKERNFVDALHCIDDDFYVVHGAGTVKIDNSALPSVVSDAPFYRMFKVENMLYGLSNRDLYVSETGDRWNLVGNLDNDYTLLSYSYVGDSTVAYYNSQIFLLKREDNTMFEATELSNEGLYGNEITSVAAFNGKVYVTTLSGVFYKDYDDFWTEKEE